MNQVLGVSLEGSRKDSEDPCDTLGIDLQQSFDISARLRSEPGDHFQFAANFFFKKALDTAGNAHDVRKTFIPCGREQLFHPMAFACENASNAPFGSRVYQGDSVQGDTSRRNMSAYLWQD